MFLRETTGQTVADVAAMLDTNVSTWQGSTGEITLRLTDEQPVIAFGPTGAPKTEIPATSEGLKPLANFLDVPEKFLLRLPADERQFIMERQLRRAGADLVLGYGDSGLVEVLKPGQQRIPAHEFAAIAGRVVDPTAEVVQWLNTGDDLRIDVMVPENFDRGVGGDREVNDITKGGIRIGQDRKHNLAPFAQPFLYRLICTNGMETRDEGLTFKIQGKTVPDVLTELEAAAQRAFGQVEEKIAAYYDLRNQRVENPERTLFALGEEQGLPTRTITNLVRRIPAEIEGEQATMFDLVNLITNAANDPAIGSRTAIRRQLETVGGNLTNEHAARCTHCAHKL